MRLPWHKSLLKNPKVVTRNKQKNTHNVNMSLIMAFSEISHLLIYGLRARHTRLNHHFPCRMIFMCKVFCRLMLKTLHTIFKLIFAIFHKKSTWLKFRFT